MEPRHQRNHLDWQPAKAQAGRPLLFERLCQSGSSKPASWPGTPGGSPWRDHSSEGLLESVVRELRTLLNTRLALGLETVDDARQTVIDYGIPDFSNLNASNPVDRERLATMIALKIARFEPRLQDVQVTLAANPLTRNGLIGVIRAKLLVPHASERVEFPVHRQGSAILVEEPAYAGGR